MEPEVVATRNLLITGATGFIGSRLCERAAESGWSVRRALRRAGNLDGVVVGDLGADTDWSTALQGVDAVVHLAARVHIMDEKAANALEEFRRVNLEGTLGLARAAAAQGVKRFIYLSSIKVNGENTAPGSSFVEENPSGPSDPYAVSKYEAEQALLGLAQETDMEAVIIRPPLVYGPGVKANFRNVMRWLDKGVPLPLGAIKNKRSLVALDNLVDLVITCLDHPAAAGEIFLVSDGEDLSTPELIRRTAAAMGRPARLLPIPQGLLERAARAVGRSDLADRLCGSLQVDISKARQCLGWTPKITVDEGLRLTTSWFHNEQRRAHG